MYRIISVDLDGTLLSPENKITEYTKEIIQLLIDKGFYFILASGRHHIDVIKIRDFLNIKSFMITSNGATVYDLDEKIISSNNLDIDIVSRLYKIKFFDQDIITQVYRNDQWYINNNKVDNNFCSNFSFLEYKYFNPDILDVKHVSKVFFTSNNFKKLYDLKKEIIEFGGDRVNINFSMPGCLEIVSGKTSKGYGLKLISNLLGVSLDKFISFGDGMNDKDMLEISGKSYIMQNADISLKNALPYLEIIESNSNDGVAKLLNKMFILKP